MKNELIETFKPYPVSPLFSIGNLGTIKSKYGRVLSSYVDSAGYHRVRIVAQGNPSCFVHRIVAQTYVPNPSGLTDVNHIDHDKSNNAVENLEWVTHRENMQKARKHHGNWSKRGADSALARPLLAVPVDGGAPTIYHSGADAAIALGKRNRACNICTASKTGRPAYGFFWLPLSIKL